MVDPREVREVGRGRGGESEAAQSLVTRAVPVLAAALALTACDKLITDKPRTKLAAAAEKAKAKEFQAAVRLYEDALDGTAETAEAHYRLAVIYDEKMRRPTSAVHHFQRYLDLAPKGPYANEAASYVKESASKLARTSGGSVGSQSELVRLKNENLNLQKQLMESKQRAAALSVTAAKRAEETKAPLPPGSRRHTVASGETPASISRKYYGTPSRAQDILDANHNQLGGKAVIKPGQVLIVP
jgi:nucleoid-associated protein YgaU